MHPSPARGEGGALYAWLSVYTLVTTSVTCDHTLWQEREEGRPSNHKSRLCFNWQKIGQCSFGNRCNFAHGSDELRARGSTAATFAAIASSSAASQADHLLSEASSAAAPQSMSSACSIKPDAQAKARNRFTYESLCVATNNFHKLLGGGGCGSVFQGVVSGTPVAVKRLDRDSQIQTQQGALMLDQMNTEVKVLSQVQHPNIVPLLGWSKEGAAPCLVYALMEGGSLQDRLALTHGSGVPLTAKERILVLSDVARGLAYLHCEISPPVIHRDVKRWTFSKVSFF
jgi:hypothetical protein